MSTTNTSQQPRNTTMTNLTYTTEQLAVIEAAPTTSLLVRARAGTRSA